ncbi:MAG: hypothetical protein SF053_16250 [Bacteroidia bacterium]|nr:hypothetical protein [Bacteroidia bacterium]
MRVSPAFSLASLFLLAGFCSHVHAQTDPLNQQISLWFLEERFIIADKNDDALLNRDELMRFPQEFGYYLDERTYSLTDKNHDTYLSFYEINARVETEYLYRYNMERRQLRDIGSQYPLLAQTDARALKQQPEVVIQLMGNLVWLYENADIAEKIYKDPVFTASHPEVLDALHRNLRWMAANPNDARVLYQNRTQTQRLPELLSWRASHLEFIRLHPRMDRFYEADFIPEAIRIQR